MEGTEPPQAGPPCSWSQKRRRTIVPSSETCGDNSPNGFDVLVPFGFGVVHDLLPVQKQPDSLLCQPQTTSTRTAVRSVAAIAETIECECEPVAAIPIAKTLFQIVTTPFHSCRCLSVSVWTGPAPKNTKHDVQRPPVLRCSSGRGGQIFF